MGRLIDADVLSKEFDRRCSGDCCNCEEDTNTESGCKIIDEAPTVDAVPVVRCKDCKHKRMVMKSGCLGCDIQCCLHPYDWYCPEGEKVTE